MSPLTLALAIFAGISGHKLGAWLLSCAPGRIRGRYRGWKNARYEAKKKREAELMPSLNDTIMRGEASFVPPGGGKL